METQEMIAHLTDDEINKMARILFEDIGRMNFRYKKNFVKLNSYLCPGGRDYFRFIIAMFRNSNQIQAKFEEIFRFLDKHFDFKRIGMDEPGLLKFLKSWNVYNFLELRKKSSGQIMVHIGHAVDMYFEYPEEYEN